MIDGPTKLIKQSTKCPELVSVLPVSSLNQLNPLSAVVVRNVLVRQTNVSSTSTDGSEFTECDSSQCISTNIRIDSVLYVCTGI